MKFQALTVAGLRTAIYAQAETMQIRPVAAEDATLQQRHIISPVDWFALGKNHGDEYISFKKEKNESNARKINYRCIGILWCLSDLGNDNKKSPWMVHYYNYLNALKSAGVDKYEFSYQWLGDLLTRVDSKVNYNPKLQGERDALDYISKVKSHPHYKQYAENWQRCMQGCCICFQKLGYGTYEQAYKDGVDKTDAKEYGFSWEN